jgi:hypothetical protein
MDAVLLGRRPAVVRRRRHARQSAADADRSAKREIDLGHRVPSASNPNQFARTERRREATWAVSEFGEFAGRCGSAEAPDVSA